MFERFIVIGKDDDGVYTLMARIAWVRRENAEAYAYSVYEGREAIVVVCPRGVDFREED